eukprot:TRINITY_DN8529_c0_g1_i2.p1 TRINITY_DN8529_c0_g1~~TRINITY_DN8529_c0_g1_i2.p1  ORF type:complete len:602 (+),score=186.33 TRINITY_DN8529_c0_g1_i2:114-1919(+)
MEYEEEIRMEREEMRGAQDPASCSSRLYVGRLNVRTNERELKEHFLNFGDVTDCFIMRFPDTKKSKCFGFINFSSLSELDKALSHPRHVLDGSTLEVRKAVPKGESEVEIAKKEKQKYQESKIFVGNLDENDTKDDLRNCFERFGNILDAFIMKDGVTGKSKCFGFVVFDSVKSMENCLANKPHRMGRNELEVKRAAPKKQYGPGMKRKFDEDEDDVVEGEHILLRKLYVGSIPISFREDEVQEYFEKFGKTVECELQKYRDTGKSKGMCFITFEKASTVDAVQAAGPHKLGNKTLEVKRPAPRGVNPKDPEAVAVTKRLWVGGFNENMTDDDIMDYFSQFGTVKDVEQMKSDTGKKRGFGFVTYDSSDVVDKVILMNNHVIKGRRMECKKALRREEIASIRERDMHHDVRDDYRYGGRRGSDGFGRGAKHMRPSYGGRDFSGYMGREQRPMDNNETIMRKIDAIYENIAELNKLTGNSSFVEALSQKVSDGGYMNARGGGGGYSEGYGGGRGDFDSGRSSYGMSGFGASGGAGGYGGGSGSGYGAGGGYGGGASGGYGGGASGGGYGGGADSYGSMGGSRSNTYGGASGGQSRGSYRDRY